MSEEKRVIMTTDLPSNSDNVTSSERKKTDKVVKGEVKTRKKTFGEKITELFIGDDISNVKDYVVYDMIIPGIKEAVLGSIEMLFFGSTRGSRRSSRSSAGKPYVSYSSYYSDRKKEPERARSKSHEMEDLIFETLQEAEAVLDALQDEIVHYNEATLASYYEMAGRTGDFTDYKYGWTNLDGVGRPRRVRGGGYILDLPRPRLLD